MQYIYDSFVDTCHVVPVCVCVCPHENLKTIAGICFLLGSYTGWRVRMLNVGQGYFFEASRLLGKVVRSCSAASEIPSRMALCSTNKCIILLKDR